MDEVANMADSLPYTEQIEALKQEVDVLRHEFESFRAKFVSLYSNTGAAKQPLDYSPTCGDPD